MDVEDLEVSIKLIVIGDGQVGKTSLITRFCKNTFTGQYKRTLGVDFLEKTKYLPQLKTEVTFHLWDTAGQEEYHAITRKYYRGAQAAILAFSIADRPSFDHLETWRQMLLEECGDIPTVLVQNKSDLIDSRVVSDSEVSSLSAQWSLPLHAISVKENTGIGAVFESLAVAVLTRKKEEGRKPVERKGTSSTGSSNHSNGREKVVLTQRKEEKVERKKRLFAYCSLL